jgi:hypothetical protein
MLLLWNEVIQWQQMIPFADVLVVCWWGFKQQTTRTSAKDCLITSDKSTMFE